MEMVKSEFKAFNLDQPLVDDEVEALRLLLENAKVRGLFECAGFQANQNQDGSIRLGWNESAAAENPKTPSLLVELLLMFSTQGHHPTLKGIVRLTLRLSLAILGPDHPVTLRSLNNLAFCIQYEGCASEALPFFEQALDSIRRVRGEYHVDTTTSLNNLSACLQSLNRASEAVPLYEQVLDSRRGTLGDEHPDTLTSLNNLAHCLDSLGCSGAALRYLEQAFACAQRVLGEEHPVTLTSLNNLASCLDSLGRFGEALPYYEQVFNTRRRKLGEDYRDTITSRNNLASCLDSLGRFGDALPYYQQALDSARREMGELHPISLTILNNLASCLKSLGRSSEALAYYQQALASTRRVLGEEHPDTLQTLDNLASCLEDLGRPSEALPLYEEALAATRRVLGENHPDTLTSLNNLAGCLESLNRASEALPFYEQALDATRRMLGEDHPYTLTSLNNLAFCLESLDRFGDALPYYEQALESRQRLLGEEHPDTLASLNNLAYCLESMKRTGDARATWIKLAEILCRKPHPAKTWLDTFQNTCGALADMIARAECSDWPAILQKLSQALTKVLDLQDPRQVAAMRPIALNFYRGYLSLCLARCPDQVPEAFAGMQGRKLAALVIEDLDRSDAPMESVLGQYRAVRLKLRQLALGLPVIGGNGPRPFDERSEQGPGAKRRKWDEYVQTDRLYNQLHQQLVAENPQFALADRALRPTLLELKAQLDVHTALVFLIRLIIEGLPRDVAFIIRARATQTKSLPGLHEACEMALHRHGPMNKDTIEPRRLVNMSFDEPDTEDSASAQEPAETVLDQLESALREGLWQPLRDALPDEIRRIHLITHGELHLLPYESGCPEHWTVATYPGFVYYYVLNHHADFTDQAANFRRLGVLVHAAEESRAPIPMVRAEAHIVKDLWPGHYQLFDFAATDAAIDWLHLAGHGNEGAFYAGPGRSIAFEDIWHGPQCTTGAFVACCLLGRTEEDPDGDPLGFLGAFFLRGTPYVIAALQPVSDLYMPLLVCLFYQSWYVLKGHPAEALAEAKRRLLAGDWYTDTENLIRSSYAPVLCDNPEIWNRSHASPEQFLQWLCYHRADLPVAELCTWVRGFGRVE